MTQAGDHRFFAGWRSDPFFFDVLGTLNNFQFTTGDFFADKDICSIVLEVPNSLLGPKDVGIWARTLIPADGAGRLGTGGSRGAAQPDSLSFRRPERCLPRRRASGRRAFCSCLRPRSGTHGRLYTRSSKTGGSKTVAATFCATTPNAPRASPTTVARSTTTFPITSLAHTHQRERSPEIKSVPHSDLLAEFPYLGPPHMIRDK